MDVSGYTSPLVLLNDNLALFLVKQPKDNSAQTSMITIKRIRLQSLEEATLPSLRYFFIHACALCGVLRKKLCSRKRNQAKPLDSARKFEMDPESEELDRHSKEMCLKAALHYTVGRISEAMCREEGKQINRQVVAALSELVFKQVERVAIDFESLAKHAKRTTVLTDDVLFCARHCAPLQKHLQSLIPAKKTKPETSKRKVNQTEN